MFKFYNLFQRPLIINNQHLLIHLDKIVSGSNDTGFHPTGARWDFHTYPIQNFKKYFRFAKREILVLFDKFGIPDELTLDNGSKINGLLAFVVTLFRMAHSAKLDIASAFFQIEKSLISRTVNKVIYFLYQKYKTKINFDYSLCTSDLISTYADCVDAPNRKCWGFMDGTFIKTCRPSGPNERQRAFYQGSKHSHGLNVQAITGPNGLYISVSDPFEGSAHDGYVFKEFETPEFLNNIPYPNDDGLHDLYYYLYADKGYRVNSYRVMTPYTGNVLTEEQNLYNISMSSRRVSVEHVFGKMKNIWKHSDYNKNNKLQQTLVMEQFLVTALLSNCHSCFYANQTSKYFNCLPPTIEAYLN